MKNKPTYTTGWVDQALRLGRRLLLEGALSITEAAHRLAVSPPAAHRLSVTHLAR